LLLARRGTPLPHQVRFEGLELLSAEGHPFEISLYLRKVNFETGEITYTKHGGYGHVLGVEDERTARISVQAEFGRDGEVNLLVEDLVADSNFRLFDLNVLGGATIDRPPARSMGEYMASAGAMSLYFRRLLDEGRSGASLAEILQSLIKWETVGGGPQRRAPRELAAELVHMVLLLASAAEPGLEDLRDRLRQMLDQSAAEAELAAACRHYLLSALRALAEFLISSAPEGSGTEGLQRLLNETEPDDSGQVSPLLHALMSAINRIEIGLPSDAFLLGQMGILKQEAMLIVSLYASLGDQ
jgi:hypothetical protein